VATVIVCLPDPASGDAGTNAQEVACQLSLTTTTAVTAAADLDAAEEAMDNVDDAVAGSNSSTNSSTLGTSTHGYSYGQAVLVALPATAAGAVRSPLTLPAAAVSAECMDVQQVGFMQRLPTSLKVIKADHPKKQQTVQKALLGCGCLTSTDMFLTLLTLQCCPIKS
jgi:hypothetical protein